MSIRIFDGWPRPVVAELLAATAAVLSAGPLRGQESVSWNGYAQVRYTGASSTSGFTLRRGKLWVEGPVPGVDDLSLKVQGIFRDQSQGAFVLQDFFAQYRGRGFALEAGQLVPDFSLERSQSDYLIPVAERAGVVNAVIPDATSLGRDLGAQIRLFPGGDGLHVSAGLFNGSGANRATPSRGAYLATTRATFARRLGRGVTGTLGGSFEMRSADSVDVGALWPGGRPYTGHEFRWGTEAELAAAGWSLQGEYLEAHLQADVSHGFYVLGSHALPGANEVAVSVEQLSTPGATHRATPWYIVGFDHLLSPAGDGEAEGSKLFWRDPHATPTTLMVDARVRSVGPRVEYQATLQLQLFVH